MSFIYRKKKYPDLFKWFCIETIEVCCPAGTYGPDCLGNFSSEKFSSRYVFLPVCFSLSCHGQIHNVWYFAWDTGCCVVCTCLMPHNSVACEYPTRIKVFWACSNVQSCQRYWDVQKPSIWCSYPHLTHL